MTTEPLNIKIQPVDDRRDLAVPGDENQTVAFAITHFIAVAIDAIATRDVFAVALSGGSTPKLIYQALTHPPLRTLVDWNKVLLFWGDERNVPPDHADSNYRMAMEAGFNQVPVPPENIFRMRGEGDIEENALAYEATLRAHLPDGRFDLMMLGMGADGHTASLFPNTHGLQAKDRWVIANYVPEKDIWRMSLTFECINNSRHIAAYVLGEDKKDTLFQVLSAPYDPDRLPAQRVGTPDHRALWIADQLAAQRIVCELS